MIEAGLVRLTEAGSIGLTEADPLDRMVEIQDGTRQEVVSRLHNSGERRCKNMKKNWIVNKISFAAAAVILGISLTSVPVSACGRAEGIRGQAGEGQPAVSADSRGITLPDIQLPDVDLPDLKLPDIKLPELKLHDWKLPELDFSDMDPEVEKERLREAFRLMDGMGISPEELMRKAWDYISGDEKSEDIQKRINEAAEKAADQAAEKAKQKASEEIDKAVENAKKNLLQQ